MTDLFNAYDDQNIFAKILRDEMPSVRVFEDEMTLAFMDVMPQAEGHVLVIPKSPATNLFQLEPAYAEAMIRTAHRVAKAVQKALDAPGVMLAQLNGAAAGQTVFHIHTHIIPRYDGLEMKLHAAEMADLDALKDVAEKIRAAL